MGDLSKRLQMFRLRAKVEIAVDGKLAAAIADDAAPDPRSPGLPGRKVVETGSAPDLSQTDWDAIRIPAGVAEWGPDFTGADVFPWEINMDRMGGLIHSQRVLLALTQNGVSREDAYRLVQRNAMKVWESDGRLMLLDLLKQDEEVTAALSAEQLEERFDLEYHFKHVDTIFERVFG